MKISQSDQDGVKVIDLEGEVDLESSPELKSVFDQLIGQGIKKVLIDLQNTSYIDSSGLATLVEMQQRLDGQQGKICLVNISDKIKGIFEITKLDKLFQIHNSKEEALSAISD